MDMHKGERLSLQQQTENLRLLGESRALAWMAPVGAVVGALALLGFWWTDSQNVGVLCLFVGGCAWLIALAAGLGARHIRNAAAGTHKGRRVHGRVSLLAGEDGETSRQFHGTLVLEGPRASTWDIVFAPASGWQPQEGALEVQAVFLSDIAWPVLVLCPHGLLWPHSTPRRSG